MVFKRAACAVTAVCGAILLGAPASASKGAAPVRPYLDLYSLRARRRAAIILQLELLELRKARLERVRRAIERRLPVDQLLKIGDP